MLINNPPTVGRTWYVEIKQGTLSSQAFLGTRHVGTGDQVWDRAEWGTDMSSLTEAEILDELYAVVLQMMERRTSDR